MIEWTPKGIECYAGSWTRSSRSGRANGGTTPRWIISARSASTSASWRSRAEIDCASDSSRPYAAEHHLVVSITPQQRQLRYRLFTARAFEGFYDYVEQQRDAGRRVVLIAAEDILRSLHSVASSQMAHNSNGP
ncbi:MAG: hypothetical protein R3F16_25390 [Myxococcota bacterium]